MAAVDGNSGGDVSAVLEQFLVREALPERYVAIARQWFLPLAEQIVKAQRARGGTLLVAINGCQGSGKSTLTALLREVLKAQYRLQVADLSIDDFYLTRAQRQKLAQTVHPLLATRGAPGTHDVALLQQTIDQLAGARGEVAVPRFDKAADDRLPKSDWSVFTAPVDIVIVEGWCMGVTHQQPECLAAPVNALESAEDPDAIWRTWVNEQLRRDYEPLYGRFDLWIMLRAPDFSCIHQWRLEQEDKLRARKSANPASQHIMSAQEVSRFIQHYQRLTEHGLDTLPDRVHFLYQLDTARDIVAAEQPRQWLLP